jgi:DNA-binding transcriptional MerR regulator
MRISELSARSGISVPTIKFYLREGLLPPGSPRAVNQADYGEPHLHDCG